MTSTDSHAAFLAAIRANPDDDAPRLIYADFLEEHGEADRAEFIRVQCELAVMKARHDHECTGTITRDMESSDLRLREQELLGLVGGSPWPGIGSVMLTWRRGFIDVIECSAAAWLRNADEILAQQPVREVTLTTWPDWECERFDRFPIGSEGTEMLAAEWPGVKFNLPSS